MIRFNPSATYTNWALFLPRALFLCPVRIIFEDHKKLSYELAAAIHRSGLDHGITVNSGYDITMMIDVWGWTLEHAAERTMTKLERHNVGRMAWCRYDD